MAIGVDFDTRGLDDAFTVLKPQQAHKVIAKSLNETVKKGRTKASRTIGQQFSIPATHAKPRLNASRASPDRLKANIQGKREGLPLIKSAKGVRQTKKGVTATTYGEKQNFGGAFIATMSSGHRGVFKRATRSGARVGRLPIKEFFGPSVADALNSDSVSAPLRAQLGEDASRNVARNIDRELRRQAEKNL